MIEAREEQISTVLSNAMTRTTGVPTIVYVIDGEAYVHAEGAGKVIRCRIAPEGWEKLTLWDALGYIPEGEDGTIILTAP